MHLCISLPGISTCNSFSGGLVTTAVICMILLDRICLLKAPILSLKCTLCFGVRSAMFSRKCVLPLLTVCSLQVPSDDVMRGLYFQTNFEIVHMKFARSHAFQGMFNAFDRSEVTTFSISVMFASAFGRTCWPFE